MTIGDYFESILLADPDIARIDLSRLIDKEMPEVQLECHCGWVCKRIIDKAKDFMNECDPHPFIRQNILQATAMACEIICFG